jgi:hypothetical protein
MATSAENITAISFVSSAHANNASDAIRHAALFFLPEFRWLSGFRWGFGAAPRPLRNAAKASAARIVTIVSEAAEIHVTGSM